jgi:hypothetical protein
MFQQIDVDFNISGHLRTNDVFLNHAVKLPIY